MTTERTALLQTITELMRQYPHWRFGQLVANVAGWADADIWDAEDAQMLAAASAHLESKDDQASTTGPVVNAG